jgi:hypothetical protein
VQKAPQTVTLTAANTIATGNYSLSLNGTSGSLTGSASVSVGVGGLANFLIIQPLFAEIVTRYGSTTQTQLQTEPQGLGISNYLLNFSVAGLPSGVIANFSPNPIPVGSTTTLSVTAPARSQWIQGALFTVVATPSASAPTNSLTLDLVIAPPPGSIPDNKTSYLRTDDTPRSIVYDAAHQEIFSSEYFLNRVDVVSTSTRQIVKSIPVLSPSGLALTIDGSEVLVGSDSQQVQAISTSSLQIVQSWKLQPISGSSYGIQTPYALADGTVTFRPSGYSVLSGDLAIWNPANNSTSLVSLPSNLGNIACFVTAGAQGTTILVASCSSPGVALVYDTSTKTFSAPLHFPGFIYNVAASPDGSRFIISDDTYGVGLYSSQLQPTSLLIPPDPYSTFIFSSDGTHIYLQVGIIFVFDGSGNFINAAPTLGTIPPGAQIDPCPDVETPFAVDLNGIIFGSADHGIAFDDSSYAVNSIFGGFTCLSLVLTPNSGRVDTATQTNFPEVVGFGSLPDVWFGDTRAAQATLGPGPAGSLSVTAPSSSQAGPVDVKLITPDGAQSYNPLDFSYGPSLLFVNGDTSTPSGGTTSYITGLGLPQDPTQIQVTVGGRTANVVTAVAAPFYGVYWPFAYPYPAVELKITLPPGSGDEDLVVTTSTGFSTLPNAIHYVQSVTDYASSDVFQSILLDRPRNQLYLSAGDHIDVFSLTTSQFLAAFTPPSLNGKKAFHGLALTPDGSKLLAANYPDGSVALINPDQPSSATAAQIIPPGTFDNPGAENIATTNTGIAFVESKETQSSGCGGSIYELNLSSLQVTAINSVGSYCIQPEGFPMAASKDGSKALLATTDISGEQEVAIYDASSNRWVTNSVFENFGGNAAVSANGTAFVTGSGVLDTKANLLGYLAWQEVFQSPGPFPSLGLEKLSDGGSLVYIPYANYTSFSTTYPGFVDIFDVNHGAHLRRINLSEEVQSVTDAMAIDAYGQNIYLITNAGLTVVKMNAAPLAIGGVTPASASVGAKVTLSGSGFQSATAAKVNGVSATATFVNANTLQFVVPSIAAGSVQLTVTNPSGETYSLDNAFTAQ